MIYMYSVFYHAFSSFILSCRFVVHSALYSYDMQSGRIIYDLRILTAPGAVGPTDGAVQRPQPRQGMSESTPLPLPFEPHTLSPFFTLNS